MFTTTLTLPSIRCVQKSKKIKKPQDDLVVENCKFPKMSQNVCWEHSKHVVFGQKTWSSPTPPSTHRTCPKRYPLQSHGTRGPGLPEMINDEQVSKKNSGRFRNSQGSLPTNSHHFQAHIYILGGITYIIFILHWQTTQRPLTQGVRSHHLPPLNAKQKVLLPQAWHFAWQRHNQWLWFFPLPWVERSVFF